MTNIPFFILIGIHLLNLGIELALHGEEKEGKHNVITSFIGSAIGITLLCLAVKIGL